MEKAVKRPMISNISTASHNLSYGELRDLAKSEPEAFAGKVQDAVNEKKLRISDIRDFRGLYQYLADVQVPVVLEQGGMQRAIGASAFPILVGTTAIAAINEAYLAIPTVGQDLVTEIDDNKKVTTMAAVYTLDNNVSEVKELQDFPEIGAGEEKVEIRHRKNGRKLTISAEAIMENEIADIVTRINALGQIASDWIEEQTLLRVTDHYGSGASPAEPYVYRPDGTGTALYSSTANTPGTRAPSGTRVGTNALEAVTDLAAARTVLRAMKDNRGKRINIPWNEVSILIPDAVLGTYLTIANSMYVAPTTSTAGSGMVVSNWGPQGNWRVGNVLSTPKLDDLSTSAWYMGAFKRQFVRKWKMRFEYVTLGEDTQAYLNSQVAFQARIAWDCEVGATDYVFVVQNLSATTAPVDA